MKNLITIIALLFTTGLFAQKQDSTIQPISVPLQYSIKDTVNNKVYGFVLAQIKENEWVFQYSNDWQLSNREVNNKLASYKPLIITYDMTSHSTWKFTTIDQLIDPDTVFADMILSMMYPYMEQMGRTLNKKVDKKK
jgi:hypothetical protein